MTWLTTGDLEEFVTAAGAFLRSRPAENTVPLAIAETLRASGPRAARDVVLFTDLANPTSNSIYQRLGYRPVHDRVILSLTGWPQRPGGS